MPSEKEQEPAKDSSRGAATRLVAYEIGRTLAAFMLLPLRAIGQAFTNSSLREGVRRDLSSKPQLAPDERQLDLPKRPLRLFISCAEASGENHALRLVQALRDVLEEAGQAAPEIFGLGGPDFAAAGVQTLGDPVSNARMGFVGVMEALPFYMGLVRSSAELFQDGTLDVFVGVDSPALNVPLAHMAHRSGVRTVQYITPQYWGWAPWRVHGFRAAYDLGLSILPFEPSWFARHGVACEYVGHPQLDALEPYVSSHANASPAGQLAVLPGSRRSVIARNLPCMLAALADHLQADSPWRARILQSNDKHRELIEGIMAKSGLPPEKLDYSAALEPELDASSAALSVSGTIVTHLFHRRMPAVVLYKLDSALEEWVGQRFLTVPYFASVNLLAAKEVYSEFGFAGDEVPADFRAAVERLLDDESWRLECSRQCEAAAVRQGPPGASRRAALAILAQIPGSGGPQPA